MRSDDEMRRLTHTDEAMAEVFARAEQAFVAGESADERWEDMRRALHNMRVISGIMCRLTDAKTADEETRAKALTYLFGRAKQEHETYVDAFALWWDAECMRGEYVREMDRQGRS